MNNKTQTQIPAFEKPSTSLGADIEAVAAALCAYYSAERDALLARVDAIEKNFLGYGENGRLTTSQIRSFYRRVRGNCPACGERL